MENICLNCTEYSAYEQWFDKPDGSSGIRVLKTGACHWTKFSDGWRKTKGYSSVKENYSCEKFKAKPFEQQTLFD